MSIALVCDVPSCDEIISPEETEALIEKFGEDKPPAIMIVIDGEEYMILDDACNYHRGQFKRMLGDFIAGIKTANQDPSVEAVKEEKPVEAEKKQPAKKKPATKIPGGLDEIIAEKTRTSSASELPVRPSGAFSGSETDGEPSKPADDAIEPQKASQPAKSASSSGPKKFVRTAQRKSEESSQSKMGGVATLEDDGAETLIEPSLASEYDFSGTTPVA